MTILLVEDHTDTRQAMRMWLEMSGHSVIEACDVKSGLAAAEGCFDLLLCDIGLPDGDGCTLLQTLSKRRSITAIAISGYCSPADIARTKAAGFLAHLAKPFNLEEFDRTLAMVASQHNGQKSSRTKRIKHHDVPDSGGLGSGGRPFQAPT
jgi:CheY-like chemotaxis protein